MEHFFEFLLGFDGAAPYFLVFGILLACGLGLPIPEDITLIAAGYLAYAGNANVLWMILVGMFGVLFGDSLIFYLGARFGRRLTKKWIFHKLLPDDRLEMVRQQFHKRGDKILFAARFMPGLRAPVFFSAGTLHVPYRRFLAYNGGAALLSVPAIVWSAYYFGHEIDEVVKLVKRVEHGILLLIGLGVALILAKWYLTHRKLKRGVSV